MPTNFDDDVIYQFGVITVAFILLDQTITDLRIDLETGEPSLAARARFMPMRFGKKVKDLRERIKQRIGRDDPASAPIIDRCNIILDRAINAARIRNDIVHGHSFTHKQTGEIHLVNLGKDRKASIYVHTQELADVADAIAQVALDLMAERSNLQSAKTASEVYSTTVEPPGVVFRPRPSASKTMKAAGKKE